MEQNLTTPIPVQENVTTPTTSPAQLQAVVDLLPNISVFGAKTVLIEWGADNRIRLFDMDFDTQQAKGILFDAAIGDIKKVTGSVNMLTFHIDDKTYRTLFAAMRTAGVAGAIGVGIALKELQASGAKLWINKLKQNGVKVSIFGWGKTFAVAISLVAIVTGIVILIQIASGTF